MDLFFSDDDLKDVLEELASREEDTGAQEVQEDDEEMKASQRRYEEILKKHKG